MQRDGSEHMIHKLTLGGKTDRAIGGASLHIEMGTGSIAYQRECGVMRYLLDAECAVESFLQVQARK